MKISQFLLGCLFVSGIPFHLNTHAQTLLRADMVTFVKTIQPLPRTLEELHRQYTTTTRQGETFSDAKILKGWYEPAKKWIEDIHRETILQRMKQYPRKDMTYDLQFDDERLKLLLRPFIGTQAIRKTATFSAASKSIATQLSVIEKMLDWRQYTKKYDSLEAAYRKTFLIWDQEVRKGEEEIPVVQTEWGMQRDEKKATAFSDRMMKRKMKFQLAYFSMQLNVWELYFKQYASAVKDLQQLLQQVQYGQDLPSNEQAFMKSVMADVQARGFEALERLIWHELLLVQQGEIFFGEHVIAKGLLNEVNAPVQQD